MGDLAAAQGATFEEKRWGDVLSFDVKEARGRKVFSFQIARRDRYLEPPLSSPWGLILIESFLDNIASKMVALVDRTAPRDLVDLYEVVTRGFIGLEDCWDLYLQKRPDADLEAARQQVLERLEQIEARRPLEGIADPEERAYAQAVRTWYHEHFAGPERLDHGIRF
jgi:Nucleotidyl transferase AbiEii toxin, Type IV TA system